MDFHANIQFCFYGLSIADRGYIFSDAADCNLEEIFQGVAKGFYANCHLFTPFNMLTEAIQLADGIHWLHDRVVTKDNQKMIGNTHEDIKPKNILVFWRSFNDSICGWRWKITDFGESSIGHHEPTHTDNGRITFPTNPKVGPGGYQPPEKETTDKAGTSTDIWSLGCTFFDMLVFTSGGPQKVSEFQKLRNSPTNAFYQAVQDSSGRFSLKKTLLQFQENQETLRRPEESSSKIWPRLWRESFIKILDPLRDRRLKAEQVVGELRHQDSQLHMMGKECNYLGKSISEAPRWTENAKPEGELRGDNNGAQHQATEGVDNEERNPLTHEGSSKSHFKIGTQFGLLPIKGSAVMRSGSFLLPVGERIVQLSRDQDQDSGSSGFSIKEELEAHYFDLPPSTTSLSVSSQFAAILKEDHNSTKRQVRRYFRWDNDMNH